jgi:biotin carboxyl carrier protein
VSSQKQFSPIALESGVFETRITRKFAQRKLYERQNPGIVKAVIPGAVSEIMTKTGNRVHQGDTLLILEAMKMLNRIMAPIDGIVKAIRVSPGQKVAKEFVLVEIESFAASSGKQ